MRQFAQQSIDLMHGINFNKLQPTLSEIQIQGERYKNNFKHTQ